MKRPTLAQLRACNTIEDLEALGLRLDYDIGHRGGYLGALGSQVGMFLGHPKEHFPRVVGCGCNYLGGGVRGTVIESTWHEAVCRTSHLKWLFALTAACKRAYIDAEGGMNTEQLEDETNWDAIATNAARAGGIKRVY